MVILVAMTFIAANAQREAGQWSLIPKLGVTLSKVSGGKLFVADGQYELKSQMRPGVEFGAELEYMATDQVGVSIAAMYSQQGAHYGDFTYVGEAKDGEADFEKTQDVKMPMDYINIPLMCNVYITDRFAVKAGVQFGCLLSSKMKYSTVSGRMDTRTEKVLYYYDAEGNKAEEGSQVYVSKEEDLKDFYKKLDVSIPIGISYEFENVILDARYRFGLNDIHDMKELSDKMRNSVFSFTVGYRFSL